MFYLLEINNATVLEGIVVSVPESVGLLVFGIGLVVIAVLLRSFLARIEKGKDEKGSVKGR